MPPAGSNSMLFPGMHFRFFTGPEVVYPNTPTTRWVPLPDPRPIGEAKGFLANTLLLTPSVPAARGNTLPPTFTAYERATIALIGAPTGHDSVSFLLDPAVTRPTIAAWTQAGSAFLFARCGMMPTQTVWDAQVVVGTGGAVLDLTAGCPSAWNVVAVNFTTADRVLHIRVGASTSASRVYDLVLGTEFTAPAPELAFIQRVLRQAAWRFYGATGGTHIIRTWTTMNGTCSGSHVCFRNRATCSPQAITHPSGSTARDAGPHGGRHARRRAIRHQNRHLPRSLLR